MGNAATPEEKIKLIFEFCRSRIKRIDSEALTDLDRARYKANKTATDTLKNESGTGSDINLLFAALAIAAGFDARLAKTPDRDDIFFDGRNADPYTRLYFMRGSNIAVRMDDKWRFFDPASTFVPYGMLQWNEEGQDAFIIGDGMESFDIMPLAARKIAREAQGQAPPERRRHARRRCSIRNRGHFAAERKAYNAYDSPEQREQTLRQEMQQRISIAEVSNVRIENANHPAQPVSSVFFQGGAQGYAQRTGKRLFFQPAFFQYGKSPRFSATERKYEAYFHYPWAEQDEVEIDLPAGFVLDRAEIYRSISLMANIGKYDVRIGITKDQRILLVYKRDFVFGDGGRIFFPTSSYKQLKQIFDVTHELDNRIITLKQAEANPKKRCSRLSKTKRPQKLCVLIHRKRYFQYQMKPFPYMCHLLGGSESRLA